MTDSLTSRVVRNIGWAALVNFLSQATQLAGYVVLWRLLMPKDFGVTAVAGLTIAALSLLRDFGFKMALVQTQEDLAKSANVTFWVNLLLNGLCYTLLFLLAAPIARFFTVQPESEVLTFLQDTIIGSEARTLLVRVLRTLGLVLIVDCFGDVQLMLFRKGLQFRKLLSPTVISSFVSTVLAVTMAYLGFGVWSLVGASLSRSATNAIVMFFVSPWRPAFQFDWKVARNLARFGMHMTGASILIFLITQGDDAIVGKILGLVALGFYRVSYNLSNLPATHVSHVLSQVIFPAYAEIGDDRARAGHAWTRVTRYTTLLALPVTLVLVCLAKELVLVFCGSKWEAATMAVTILGVFGFLRAVGVTFGELFKGMGKPKYLTRIAFVQACIVLPLVYYATRWGIEGACWAVVFGGCLADLMGLVYMHRLTGTPWGKVVQAFAPSGVSGVAMALTLLGGKHVLSTMLNLPAPATLAILLPVAAAVYGAVCYGLYRDLYREAKSLVFQR